MRKKNYVAYDYENEFIDPLDHANELVIKNMLSKGMINSIYCTKTIKAGNQLEIEIYPEFTKKQAREYKLTKKHKQAQRNLNDRNARKKFERLINVNFGKGDMWLTLTYSNECIPKSYKEAHNNIKNYVRRINYRRKKAGLGNAKYLFVTEFSDKNKIRCHHHLIIEDGLSMEVIESVWKHGRRNNVRKVDPDKDGLTGLANYLVKDPKGSKRWGSSLNLKKPKETKSYHGFKSSHVKKMVKDHTKVQIMVENRHKNHEYTKSEIK
ncbi:rolling circle replication-associated protein, partial [Thomasclavelia sp.]